jgi:hypothetical protein
MYSIFEEEELVSRRMMMLSPKDQPATVSFSVTSTLTPRPADPTWRKRSRTEAMARAELITGMVTSAGQVFPIARPYTTLFNLTFSGLVLVDPLNRLEGI